MEEYVVRMTDDHVLGPTWHVFHKSYSLSLVFSGPREVCMDMASRKNREAKLRALKEKKDGLQT